MSDSTIIDVADAIVAMLTAAALPITPATIERRYVPAFDLSELKDLMIAVAPMAIDPRAPLDRQRDSLDCVVAVSLMQKLTDVADPDDLDDLVAMALATAKALAAGKLPAAMDAKLIQMKHDPIIDVPFIKHNRTFFSIITTTWRVSEVVRVTQAAS